MTRHAEHAGTVERIIDQDTDLPGVFDLARQLRVDTIRCSIAASNRRRMSG